MPRRPMQFLDRGAGQIIRFRRQQPRSSHASSDTRRAIPDGHRAHSIARRRQLRPATIHADLEVQFAGQTAHYKQIAFQLVTQGNDIKLSGTIPATLSDFKIQPPSLLTMPIKNEIPVRVEMTWQRAEMTWQRTRDLRSLIDMRVCELGAGPGHCPGICAFELDVETQAGRRC